MAVHIRLSRVGAKKAPLYHVVVADQRSPRGGKSKWPRPPRPRRRVARRRSPPKVWASHCSRGRLRLALASRWKRRRSMALKELIETIAKALVDDPEAVEVTEIEGEHNLLIELRVAKDDVGKVIGREGRTAQSMRTILTAASTKLGRRSHLDIVD